MLWNCCYMVVFSQTYIGHVLEEPSATNLIQSFQSARCQSIEEWESPINLKKSLRVNPFATVYDSTTVYPFVVLFQPSEYNINWIQLASGDYQLGKLGMSFSSQGKYALIIRDHQKPCMLLIHRVQNQLKFTFYKICVLHH